MNAMIQAQDYSNQSANSTNSRQVKGIYGAQQRPQYGQTQNQNQHQWGDPYSQNKSASGGYMNNVMGLDSMYGMGKAQPSSSGGWAQAQSAGGQPQGWGSVGNGIGQAQHGQGWAQPNSGQAQGWGAQGQMQGIGQVQGAQGWAQAQAQPNQSLGQQTSWGQSALPPNQTVNPAENQQSAQIAAIQANQANSQPIQSSLAAPGAYGLGQIPSAAAGPSLQGIGQQQFGDQSPYQNQQMSRILSPVGQAMRRPLSGIFSSPTMEEQFLQQMRPLR